MLITDNRGQSMQKTSFGKTKEGKEVTKYTIGNKNGMTLCVLDLGATIQALCVPDASGKSKDVVLGYDNPIDYQTHTCYFGALAADRTEIGLVIDLRAVAHQEAADAGELVSLLRQDDDIEFDVGKVVAAQVETRVVSVLRIDS